MRQNLQASSFRKCRSGRSLEVKPLFYVERHRNERSSECSGIVRWPSFVVQFDGLVKPISELVLSNRLIVRSSWA